MKRKVKAQRVQIIPLYRYKGHWHISSDGKLYIEHNTWGKNGKKG